MSDRETRLREIRERAEHAASHGGPFDYDEDHDLIIEDVPWLLAEVERLREELDGVKCELELRKTLHVQPEESEHIARTSDLLIRTLQENRDLRERLEILECHDEDTRGRLNPDARDIQRMAAFEYPGSAVDG